VKESSELRCSISHQKADEKGWIIEKISTISAEMEPEMNAHQ
jgi:hypothetical protein